MNLKNNYVRYEKKPFLVKNLLDLLENGIFTSSGDETFTEAELAKIVRNLLLGINVPFVFGAIETEEGNVVLKSKKAEALVKEIKRVADSGELSPLGSRKLTLMTYIDIGVISEGQFYNPGITREDVIELLTYHS